MKRGIKLEVSGAICVAIGCIIGLLLQLMHEDIPIDVGAIFQYGVDHPFYAFSILITAAATISRIRYF